VARVLVTGPTGYIGGRLTARLLAEGHSVRVLVRDPARAAGRRWADRVEMVRGDLLDPDSLRGLLDGIEVAYYLVHAMRAGKGFAQRDRLAAQNFCTAASGLEHAIYLGGLLPSTGESSRHLDSRAEIGEILAAHLPTTELRAGPIIGSGSASFEMLRYVTERLPVMLVPSWVNNQIQPIAVRDVLSYLLAALDRGPTGVVDIGSSDRLTYRQMIEIYANVRALRRYIVSMAPFVPPRVGARVFGLVTPIPYALAEPLVEGMSKPLLADCRRAVELFPEVEPMSYERAVERALMRIRGKEVETRWSGALTDAATYEYRDRRGMVRETRSMVVDATPAQVFRSFSSLGGDRGWLTCMWAWRARGFIDQLVGGPGLRRGRRHPEALLIGEALDFWRVEALDPPHLLRLRGEAKMPGMGWLQWETSVEPGGTRLTQTAAFAPRGLPGTLYWGLLYPFHRMIFTSLLHAISESASEWPDELSP
jgi:uncharacterized protein YbjT (DUF2867 family)